MVFYFWGIDLMNCKIQPKEQKGIFYYFYLTYFYKDSCLAATLTEIFKSEPNSTLAQTLFETEQVGELEFPEETLLRSGTYHSIRALIVFNTFWMMTTLIMLVAVCLSFTCIIFYVPWLIITAIMILSDMCVGTWFSSHIPSTYGPYPWYHQITNKYGAVLAQIGLVYPHVSTAYPAIFMTAMFTKFLFIWYINICMFMFVLQNTIETYKAWLKKKKAGCVCQYIESEPVELDDKCIYEN